MASEAHMNKKAILLLLGEVFFENTGVLGHSPLQQYGGHAGLCHGFGTFEVF